MDNHFAKEIDWLLGRSEPPATCSEIWKWWEQRRLFYNVFVLCCISLSFYAYNFVRLGLYKEEFWYEPLTFMFLFTVGTLIWNLAYTVGMLVDLIFFRLIKKWFGQKLYQSGLAFSLFVLFLPTILLFGFKFCPKAHAEDLNRVFNLMAKSKYSAALNVLQKDHLNLNGEGEYLEGYCLMRLHQLSEAKPHFLKSVQLGYTPYSQWTSTREFLDRIDRFEQIRPVRQPNACIEIYAANSNWTNPILKELPRFADRAKYVFGNVPKITFYILAKRKDFSTLYRDMFQNSAEERWWNNGTGVSNVVVFSERDKDGKWSLFPGTARAYGDVLHEYGHALCDTIYGDNYLDHVPEWLNEGMADAIARPYYGELFLDSDNLLHRYAQKNKPPEYEVLCHGLYRSPDVGYAFGRLMVEQLLAGDVRRIAAIVSNSRVAQDFEAGIKSATGKSGKDAYNAVVKKYWSR
ncbi:MAG: hypothetical protein SFY67_06605 [Candidatus Melainabacteria bacterium]|nr:hypothetical protein [Candidatus Melainabacteria bacterium]